MKKIIITLLAFIFLNSCGYTPIYSSKNFNFKFSSITNTKNDQLHQTVEKKLRNFSSKESQKTISIKINAKKKINVLAKDNRGDPSRYEMNINIDLETSYAQNQITTQSFQERFNYKTDANRFNLNQYEKEIEDLLINKNIENIVVYLSGL